jgi:hypothetical protein
VIIRASSSGGQRFTKLAEALRLRDAPVALADDILAWPIYPALEPTTVASTLANDQSAGPAQVAPGDCCSRSPAPQSRSRGLGCCCGDGGESESKRPESAVALDFLPSEIGIV